VTGKTDLPTLFRTMQPVLRPGVFVFVALPLGQRTIWHR
jgi:hypothetical protein